MNNPWPARPEELDYPEAKTKQKTTVKSKQWRNQMKNQYSSCFLFVKANRIGKKNSIIRVEICEKKLGKNPVKLRTIPMGTVKKRPKLKSMWKKTR